MYARLFWLAFIYRPYDIVHKPLWIFTLATILAVEDFYHLKALL